MHQCAVVIDDILTASSGDVFHNCYFALRYLFKWNTLENKQLLLAHMYLLFYEFFVLVQS